LEENISIKFDKLNLRAMSKLITEIDETNMKHETNMNDETKCISIYGRNLEYD